ncbi:A24 family peptidase [Vibrio hippocampi]|uniref:A24 family peptidase n=1 Tax=Vibrio hippocampi TaxID=654686 RepID=UPI0025B64FCE|nr:prepilin peptidase [Vibrio hippocampi]
MLTIGYQDTSAATLVILLLLCFLVSVSDIRRRRIPNVLSLLILVLCSLGFKNSPCLESALVVLIGGLILGKAGLIAYGDIKLATALSTAIPLNYLWYATSYTVLVGGILSIIYAIKYRWLLATPKGSDPGLPYGVAICSGFLVTIVLSNL